MSRYQNHGGNRKNIWARAYIDISTFVGAQHDIVGSSSNLLTLSILNIFVD